MKKPKKGKPSESTALSRGQSRGARHQSVGGRPPAELTPEQWAEFEAICCNQAPEIDAIGARLDFYREDLLPRLAALAITLRELADGLDLGRDSEPLYQRAEAAHRRAQIDCDRLSANIREWITIPVVREMPSVTLRKLGLDLSRYVDDANKLCDRDLAFRRSQRRGTVGALPDLAVQHIVAWIDRCGVSVAATARAMAAIVGDGADPADAERRLKKALARCRASVEK